MNFQQVYTMLQKPLYQGLFFILLSVLIVILVRPKSEETIWTLTGIIYALFILFNSVFYFYADNTWPYFFYSLGISVLYLVIIAVISQPLINLFKAEGSGESGMIFLIIIYHPFILLLMIFIKWIYIKLC